MKWLKHLFRHGPSSKHVEDPNEALVARATHSVVLRLDPTKLDDADLQVRWEIRKLLAKIQPALPFYDDGYGFAKHSDAMFLAYATSDPARLVDALIGICEREDVCGNRLGRAAMIGLAQRTELPEAGDDFDQHRIVYPPADRGGRLPD